MQNTATLENSSAVSHEINIYLPYDPAVQPPGICPNEMKTYVHIKTCTKMFIASLFINAKDWKQPECPSTGECINKQWYIHPREYYSAIWNKLILAIDGMEMSFQNEWLIFNVSIS